MTDRQIVERATTVLRKLQQRLDSDHLSDAELEAIQTCVAGIHTVIYAATKRQINRMLEQLEGGNHGRQTC